MRERCDLCQPVFTHSCIDTPEGDNRVFISNEVEGTITTPKIQPVRQCLRRLEVLKQIQKTTPKKELENAGKLKQPHFQGGVKMEEEVGG